MVWVVVAAALLAAAAADPMQLLLFNESYATQTGARCLDGSAAGAYYSVGDPHRFVIYLEVCVCRALPCRVRASLVVVRVRRSALMLGD